MYLDDHIKKPYKFLDLIDLNFMYYDHIFKNEKIYYFMDEIDRKYYKWSDICKNKNLVTFISDNLSMLDENCWNNLYQNENAITIIKNRTLNTEDMVVLCLNINAIPIIEENIHKLNGLAWNNLCSNINAIPIIKKNFHKLTYNCWKNLCKNPNAIEIIEENKIKIFEHYWKDLFKNTNAVELIEECIQFIVKNEEDVNLQTYIYELCENPNTIHILYKYIHLFDKYYMKKLAKNPKALNLIKSHVDDFTYWKNLCSLRDEDVIIFINENMDKLDGKCYEILAQNPYAINIISENIDKFINIPELYANSGIIIEDKEKLENIIYITEDLIIEYIEEDEEDDDSLDILEELSLEKFEINDKIFEIEDSDIDIILRYNLEDTQYLKRSSSLLHYLKRSSSLLHFHFIDEHIERSKSTTILRCTC
tara:strand:+ start:3435 stop:4700 length:1266 start_codon:yes stop_codon:yes gene_type:complete